MAGRHRYSGRGVRATVRLATVVTVLTGGLTVVAVSQSSGDPAAGSVAATVEQASAPSTSWTPTRMAAATAVVPRRKPGERRGRVVAGP